MLIQRKNWMKSLRTIFTQRIQRQSLNIRRCNNHCRFHSIVFVDDHSSLHTSLTSKIRFPLLAVRCYTTSLNRDRVSDVSTHNDVLGIDDLLQNLKKNVKNENFVWNLEQLGELFNSQQKAAADGNSTPALTESQMQQLVSSLNDWTKRNHSDRNYVEILKSLASLRFSVRNADQRAIIIDIVDKYFQRKQNSFHLFATFLTAIKCMNYSGASMHYEHRQRIQESLNHLRFNSEEILNGIKNLGKEMSDEEIQNMLSQLKPFEDKKFFAGRIAYILLSFGKLSVNLRESEYKQIFLELTGKALVDIEADSNGQGKRDLTRVVSF
jgi:hypothetical protein